MKKTRQHAPRDVMTGVLQPTPASWRRCWPLCLGFGHSPRGAEPRKQNRLIPTAEGLQRGPRAVAIFERLALAPLLPAEAILTCRVIFVRHLALTVCRVCRV